MPSDRKHSTILPVAVAVLLLTGYVGAYLLAVADAKKDRPGFHELSYYENRWHRIFAPVHSLDRRLRRLEWKQVDNAILTIRARERFLRPER